MRNQLRQIPLAEIDAAGSSFDIFCRLPSPALVDSVRMRGVLEPLWGIERGERVQLLSGFRRWRAAVEVGMETLPVFVLPESTPTDEQLDICLQLAVGDKPLPLMAQARLARAARDMTDDPIGWLRKGRNQHFMSIAIDVFSRLNALLDSPKEMQDYFQQHDAPLAVASTFLRLPESFQVTLFTWAVAWRIRPVELEKIALDVTDCSKRESRAPDDVWMEVTSGLPASPTGKSRARCLDTLKQRLVERRQVPLTTLEKKRETTDVSAAVKQPGLDDINRIVIVGHADAFPLTQRVIERSGIADVQHLSEDDYGDFLAHLPYAESKRVVALSVFPGSFARPCPGTKQPYLCCMYEILSPVVNCPIGCTYCILQCYLNEPVNVIYVNVDGIVEDALARYAKFPGRLVRVGTGELGDSLVFEDWTGVGETLVDSFAGRENIIFELKTKTTRIDTLLERPAPANVVLSWSLNPAEIARSEETRAASPGARIEAARRAVEHGYMVGFHFDPIIEWPNGRELYRELVEQLLAAVPAERVAWISLGCLRYPGELLPVVREYQARSTIFSSEMIRGLDGKWRYPRPKRAEMYQWVAKPLRENAPDVFTYLCMELPELWEKALGWSPKNNADFDKQFASSLRRRFPHCA